MTTTKKKNTFLLYTEYAGYFDQLEMDERGRLITALFRYQIADEEPEELSPAAFMAFSFMRDQLDRDNEKYKQMCEKNRNIATNRYQKHDTLPDVTTRYLNDNDNENDNDYVYDNENGGSAGKGGAGRGAAFGRGRKKEEKKEQKGSFDTDEFFEAALRRSYSESESADGQGTAG